MCQARDALATAIEDRIAEGETPPASVEEGGRAEIDTESFQKAQVILVPVEMPDMLGGSISASAERS
jgi:hypothetical protein